MSTVKAEKDSPIRKTAARLLAVQAIYQQLHNAQAASLLVNEYLSKRTAMAVEGENGEEVMVLPDGVLFKNIVEGADKSAADIGDIVAAQLQKSDNSGAKKIELLLEAILRCGTYELIYHQEIDLPVIINDYIEISHGFYEGGESKLVNAVLDNIAKSVR